LKALNVSRVTILIKFCLFFFALKSCIQYMKMLLNVNKNLMFSLSMSKERGHIQKAQEGPIHFKCRKNIYILITFSGLFTAYYTTKIHIFYGNSLNTIKSSKAFERKQALFAHSCENIGICAHCFVCGISSTYSLIGNHEITTLFMYENGRFNNICYKRSIFNRGSNKLFECVLSSPRALVEQLPSDVPVNNIAISSYAAFSLSYQENVFLKS
jgi:hypothetical protein